MQETNTQAKKWYRNIPNALTMLRVVFIIPMAVLFLQGERLLSLLFFLLAGLSDLLDGYLARKLDIVSNFGKVMDPVADKLMLLTIIACLFAAGDLPLHVIAIILAKEAVMLLGGAVLLEHKVIIPANAVGKLGTALFTIAVVLAFLAQYTDPWYLYVMYAAVAFSIFSLIQYAVAAIKLFRNRNRTGKDDWI